MVGFVTSICGGVGIGTSSTTIKKEIIKDVVITEDIFKDAFRHKEIQR